MTESRLGSPISVDGMSNTSYNRQAYRIIDDLEAGYVCRILEDDHIIYCNFRDDASIVLPDALICDGKIKVITNLGTGKLTASIDGASVILYPKASITIQAVLGTWYQLSSTPLVSAIDGLTAGDSPEFTDLTLTGDLMSDSVTTDHLIVNDELTLPIATPMNAVAATLPITVGTIPADYVANVQAYAEFIAGGDNAEEGQLITFDNQVYAFKVGAVTTYEVEIGSDLSSSIINAISKANSNPDSKVDIVRTGNNFVATFKTTAYLGALGNAKIFSTNITGSSVDGNFANGVTEVIKKTTLNGIDYIYWNDPVGDDPTDVYPDAVLVNTAASEADTATALAAAITTDPDMISAVAVDAVVTVTYGTKGDVGNSIAFSDSTGGLVTAPTATMDGGSDGTPGLKGMILVDEFLTETWICGTDDYTSTQSSWYKVAESASMFTALGFKASLSGAIFTGNVEVPSISLAGKTAAQVAAMAVSDGQMFYNSDIAAFQCFKNGDLHTFDTTIVGA